MPKNHPFSAQRHLSFPLRPESIKEQEDVSSNLVLGFSKLYLRMDKPPGQKIYEFDEFRFDAEHLMLYREDEPVPLAPKAAETLLVLIENRGEILSKDQLIERIWPNAFVE